MIGGDVVGVTWWRGDAVPNMVLIHVTLSIIMFPMR